MPTHRSMIGRPVRRREDPRLVTGGGRYVDDLRLAGMVHAAFVRSMEPHALIRHIDASHARAHPGVVGVFTGNDLGLEAPMPNFFPTAFPSKQAPPLALGEVCHVGEPVAVVVAEDRYLAADAAALVEVDYEPLPSVASHLAALDPHAPPVHHGSTTNLVTTLHASFGDVDGAFAAAHRVVRVRLTQHRGACASMEPRGVVAHDDPTHDQLVVWSSTQSPLPLRMRLAEYLGLSLERLRVIAPDVGGGFGPKAAVYQEEYVITALARRLGRPVKWIEGRREHFVATTQQRDQSHDLEVAVDERGVILAIRGHIVHDNGAYVPYGVVLPTTGLNLFPGPYAVTALDLRMDVVYTNLPPTSPIRGAGRPYTVFALERCIDAVGRELGIDPVEVRRRNFIPRDAFPYEVPLPSRGGGFVTYDSGDYLLTLDEATHLADRAGFEQRRIRARAEGKLAGLGLASYIEDTGLGPFEGARIEIMPSGTVVVDTGAASQGQGHATVFAQICAEALGVEVDDVVVRSADSDRYGYGVATVASRTAVTAGSSVHLGAVKVADLARRLAAERLEAAVEDLVLEDGQVSVRGQPGTGISLGDLAASVQGRSGTALHPEIGPGLAAEGAFRLPGPSYAFGTHVAEVEIDIETGHVRVVRYGVAHDCGTILNPMIVDGQIDGGVAHGLGNALSERVAFDSAGNPHVTTFMDYRIPTAVEMPRLTKVHTVTPAPDNPLGVKGAGEGGTLPAAAAVVAAVEDALADFGVVVDRYPITSEMVLGWMERDA